MHMGFQYYKRHEWWLDDQRTYRPRKKRRANDYFLQVAKRHGFDADTGHFGFSDADIRSTGTKVSDWMLCLHPLTTDFYDEQRILCRSFYWFENSFIVCAYKEIQKAYDANFYQIYVLKSDYDWTIQEKDCDIEELI